jgi:hypothetical protein
MSLLRQFSIIVSLNKFNLCVNFYICISHMCLLYRLFLNIQVVILNIFMSNEETNPDVNDLLDALKAKGDIKVKATSTRDKEFTLDKDDVEAFILNNTGKLITDSMSYIDDIGEYVSAAPDSRDVEALAKLISSSATALDSLQKIHIANEKNKNAVFIKTLDIESKQVLQQSDQHHKLLLNREELMTKLIVDAEVEVIESDETSPEEG